MIFNKINIALFAIILIAFQCNNYGQCDGIDLSQLNVKDIQQQLPIELPNTNMTVDDVKNIFKEKCIQVAGEEKGNEAFLEIETAVASIGECISQIANYSAIQIEIDEASPRGELDVVFQKYCKKRPEALKCIEDFNKKLEPCLDANELENRQVIMRIVRSLLDFICHKGGDQIALFIAEKGPECLESKKDDINQCLNNTFASYIPKDGIDNVKNIPKFVVGAKQCDEIQQLENCIIKRLEACSEITPANIVESMFRFIRNETVCRNTPTPSHHSYSKSGVSSSLSTIISFSTYITLWTMLFIMSKRFLNA